MARSALPLTATGDWIDAAWINQYLRDNDAATWSGSALGAIPYYTGTNTKSALAKPSMQSYLRNSSSGVPEWVADEKTIMVQLNEDVALVSGDYGAVFAIPEELDGWDVIDFTGIRQAGTGTVTLQLRNVTDGVDVCSTELTLTGTTYSTNSVINTSNDAVAEGDLFAVDVDGAGTNTFYCVVAIRLRKP